MSKITYDELNLKKFKMSSILPDATILLLGKRRSGKCLKKGTGILMYDGTVKKIEDVKEGDYVMGDDSTKRRVLATHNGYDYMYNITNQYGDTYCVNTQHILSLRCTFYPSIKKMHTGYKVIWFDKNKLKIMKKVYYNYNTCIDVLKSNTSEIINIPVEKYMNLTNKIKKFIKGYQTSIDFNNKQLPISPYLFGLLISEKYKHTRDSKILHNLNAVLPIKNSYLHYNTSTCMYEIHGLIKQQLNIILKHNKETIPEIYKINSFKNRIMFLLGVLEMNGYFTNGYYNSKEDHQTFLNELMFIIKSLGFSTYTFNEKIYIMNGEKILFTKKDLLNNYMKKYTLNTLSIQKEHYQEYFGFQIDGNSLFVLDNCIVTHNSWLVRDIFYHHQNIPSGIIFSGTEEANPFFGEFVPDCFIHNEYDSELIEKIMTKQKKKIRDAKKEGIKDGKSPANNLFIVFDDMLHDAQNWKNEKTIKNIFFNGRHYNFLFILTMQYALAIPPALRSNIDYVFVFNEQSLKNRRKIYDDYAAMIPSFDHFCNILDACTQNHECLVIKASGNSTDIRDSVFWYKAKPHENFRVGHYKFWKFHNQHYNKNYEDDHMDEEDKINELKEKFSKTKKLKVIVSREDDKIVDIDY